MLYLLLHGLVPVSSLLDDVTQPILGDVTEVVMQLLQFISDILSLKYGLRGNQYIFLSYLFIHMTPARLFRYRDPDVAAPVHQLDEFSVDVGPVLLDLAQMQLHLHGLHRLQTDQHGDLDVNYVDLQDVLLGSNVDWTFNLGGTLHRLPVPKGEGCL